MARPLAFLLTCWLSIAGLFSQSGNERLRIDTLTLMDMARGRAIPVAYYNLRGQGGENQRVVVLSHGYNENLPGTFLHYSFLAKFLAEQGYFVASIQHELPGDEPLAMKGDLRTLRRPNWERGAANILFVLNELKRTHPELDFARATLIGHSNGGDMSVLFVQQHPEFVESLITLDNRRMPLPRTDTPRVLSIRSSDAPADEGVLPTAEEQATHHIHIIALADVKHNEMSDRGNAQQRESILRPVLGFLTMANDR